MHCIQSASGPSGENKTEADKIADRWRENCEELYYDNEVNVHQQQQYELELASLGIEVATAINQRASRKCTGPDEIPIELFKEGGESTLGRMHRICVALWDNGQNRHSSLFQKKVI